MTVRPATEQDLPAIVRMALEFIATSGYRGLVGSNAEQLEVLVRWLLGQGGLFVLSAAGAGAVGMVAANVCIHPMSGECVGSELAWWIDPAHRGGSGALRLLSTAEQWARAQGAVRFQMIAPVGVTRLKEFYRRRGYLEVETVYQRSLEAA